MPDVTIRYNAAIDASLVEDVAADELDELPNAAEFATALEEALTEDWGPVHEDRGEHFDVDAEATVEIEDE